MKSSLRRTSTFSLLTAIALAAFGLVRPAAAQLVAYDDAGNYGVTANWTNGANQGFGFVPWAFTTNGPDSHGTYLQSANSPAFVIASVTNILGTNYTDIWGTYANGTTDINESVLYRGFQSPLGTNTFKVQWGSRGAGQTTTTGSGVVHGWCGFTLRNGNATNSTADFQNGVQMYLYFLDGAAPSTLYIWDGQGVKSVTNTSFSDLGRNDITNAVQAEITVANDGTTYRIILKDCVQGRTLYSGNGMLMMGGSSVDSAALFCHETTGDQIYNRMQIALPHIPPSIANLTPANGSIYLDANTTVISFEVDSFNSTVISNAVSVYLNGVQQSGLTFDTGLATSQLFVTNNSALAPNTFYNLTIVAQDANGDSSTNNFTFNTFLPSDLYIDAYDYNYGMGQFVNSITPSNSYAGLLGTNGIDYNISDLAGTNNQVSYRAGDLVQTLSLNTDATGDPIDHANLRANGFTAYNVGFTDTGNWENYTRVVPTATNYSIYARAASVTGGQFEIERHINPTATISNQPVIALGRVTVPNTGGSKVYSGQLQPMTDLFGNTVVVPLSGTNTLRQTAIANRVYNLEYLLVAAVTNATTTLRPYIAVGSPAPNATGIGISAPITFTVANRQTSVTPNTNGIKLSVNNSNVTQGLVLSTNLGGVVATYTPSANLPVNSNITVTAIFTDSGAVSQTNTWVFTTGAGGGVVGNGLWSGNAGPLDMAWSTATNWFGLTPGPGANATFATPGSTTNLVTNNIVTTNITVQGLFYFTNNNGYHTTLIQDGVTLTITNGSVSIVPIFQVGGSNNTDNVFNKKVTNTITGLGGAVRVAGNAPGFGANQLNFQVRQCAFPAAPEQVVLDMSGLGTFVASVGKFYVAQGGANGSTSQTNVSGRVNLARTNVITCLRPNAGQFEVGDSSGGTFTLPGSTMNLGITNALFVDTMRIGKQKATNNLVRFNPDFNSLSPSVYIRGTNGAASRLTTWTIGDADTETTVPNYVQALVDFGAGRVDGMVNNLILARGEASATDSGFAQGTLNVGGGTLDVTTLQAGVQRGVNTAVHTAVINLTGSSTLICSNVTLAATNVGANPANVSGTINATNSTLRLNVNAGGGASAINLSSGSLFVIGKVGTAAVPLSSLYSASSTLHFSVDGNSTSNYINVSAISASATSITIDSVANVTGPTTIHLIGYTGTDPYSALSLNALPSGYTGNLVDNAGVIDLAITVSAAPPSPKISTILVSGTQLVLSGTNNNGAGGTYKVLTTTNLSLARSNWTILTNSTFDLNGRFSVTNSAGTNSQRYYTIQVP